MIFANHQFKNLGVVGIVHRNQTHLETMFSCQIFDFISIVISHQKIAFQRFSDLKSLVWYQIHNDGQR